MNNWPRVKTLFHAALVREPEARAAFLRTSEDEPDVRAEVERLLAAHDKSGGFIEQSPVAAAGRIIGRYQIERRIGAGGMGEVYLDRDRELSRYVALKIAFGTDASAHARLKREAQNASQLNHPHICTIHEVGSFDGQPFGDALTHAHRLGVHHRDLKAANVVVAPEGRAKVSASSSSGKRRCRSA